MVLVEEISETTAGDAETVPIIPSTERLLDAEEIESALSHIVRPTARAQIEALVTKIRRDAAALKRMEATSQASTSPTEKFAAPVVAKEPTSISSSVLSSPVMQPPSVTTKPPKVEGRKYLSIDKFSFDAGRYNTPTVTLYIPLPSPAPTKVECDFTNTSFDLQIQYDEGGKEYRLFKDNLEKEIDGEKCKYIVKSNKILIKLRKVKAEYGSYDSWTNLSAKASDVGKKSKSSKSDDPSAGIMNMMKDMYDSGDDSMKKMIGETMLKQREGKLGGGSGGMGDMGGLGDMWAMIHDYNIILLKRHTRENFQ